MEDAFKLDELAERAGISSRTVRYYVQRGLLPAPVFRGRDTVYSSEHLLRLRAIRRLQERFLPLDAIQVEIARRSPEALRALADGTDEPAPVATHVAADRAAAPSHPMHAHHDAPVHFKRYQLAPGLELHLADDADASARALADELRAHVARRHRDGGTKR